MADLPTDRTARKHMPIGTGCLDYFPDALGAVAECSYVATQQHHPGSAMHWDKSKSTDEADCLIRHFLERGTLDTDGVRHSAKVAWRALALLQREIEAEKSGDSSCNSNDPAPGSFSFETVGERRLRENMDKIEAKVPYACPDLDQQFPGRNPCMCIRSGANGYCAKDRGVFDKDRHYCMKPGGINERF